MRYPYKVAVIVPIYNVEKYINKCVDSLIKQTYQNIEIILVDDGSPDGCSEICDNYALRYDNIVALHKTNGGLSDARNYGVKHTECDWIAFVDSDDYVEPQYIETLVKLQVSYNADLVITKVARENEDGSGQAPHKHFSSYKSDAKSVLFDAYCGKKIGWQAYGKLYKKASLIQFPFPDGYYEDCACMYNIIYNSSSIAIGDYIHNYHYIYREGSILNSDLSPKHFHIFEIAKEFEAFINKKMPEYKILVPIFYARGITQILNLHKLDKKTYYKVFYMKQKYFRKNIREVLMNKMIPKSTKRNYLFLCLSPLAYSSKGKAVGFYKKYFT